ncbi:hypothetical protein [Streptomyces daghestanicus]|uniref:Peptidase n=1 Tax=Streptomyces daghestanicus TaxID=66885 RepID=A0ABQ3Q5R9_9ACTN|nr:hypothetical protein [Streptomyces daghestanicus]GGU26631.1 hypothetical protein GCM10010259_16600 [Streptomyces daghestanicus]GHI32591.1 hypothetical protein Sdagh_43210 [Streptomyces daghestanicus]
MGWRTSRAGTRRGSGPRTPPGPLFRCLATAAAALCLTAVLPAGTAGAAGPADGYAFAAGARRVDAADGTAAAARLTAGATYRSSLERDRTAYYGIDLDGAADAYVSVTAVPRSGGEVVAVDGVRVSLRDADGGSCSLDTATFGAARSPRPVTAWARREITPGATRCQEPGRYYLTVERARPQDSPAGTWDLELTAVSEPGLRRTAATTAPGTWDSATPAPLTGDPVPRRAGAGFAGAVPLSQGVWRAEARPGQTLYYEVPLDWGRQLHATAELGGSDGRSGYATAALSLALHNPVRGQVDSAATGYTGRRATVGIGPVPPVDHDNRYAVTTEQRATRFAGSYYLVVHLAEQLAERFGDGPFEVVLRVQVSGRARTGPAYAGEPVPRGVFEATDDALRAAAPEAAGGGGADGDPAMRVVAVAGIGAGSVLLAGLGVWTVVARRRGA